MPLQPLKMNFSYHQVCVEYVVSSTVWLKEQMFVQARGNILHKQFFLFHVTLVEELFFFQIEVQYTQIAYEVATDSLLFHYYML